MTELNVKLVMVSSIDGVISRKSGESVKEWSSKEDQTQLLELVSTADAVITGRKSFSKKLAEIPYYIYSNARKSTQEEAADGIYFTNETPEQLLEKLENQGLSEIVILGGPSINQLFLEKNLVDELFLTVEPQLFGEGLHLADQTLHQDLQLLESTVLNARGSLLLHYQILK
jgi:dihydrofolate reductase